MASIDYSKKKVAELEAELKARGLPHTGKKAELITRLQEDDAKKASAAKPSTTTTADEDQIDWDDDEPAAPAPAPAPATTASTTAAPKVGSNPPATAAIAAGGKGQVANPTKVPNQAVDTDPSKTDDLTVDPPAPTSETAAKEDEAEKKEEAPPPTDFTSGLSTTVIDDEITKRQKRAIKFGEEQEESAESLKALERSKKFAESNGEGNAAVKRLDEALPERVRKERGVKRGREESKDTRPASKRRESGKREARSGSRAQAKGRGGAQMSEKDRLAAEKRKTRFA